MPERRCKIEFWQEPNGYWSASLVFTVPGYQMPFTAEKATLCDADDAIEWGRHQLDHMLRGIGDPSVS